MFYVAMAFIPNLEVTVGVRVSPGTFGMCCLSDVLKGVVRAASMQTFVAYSHVTKNIHKFTSSNTTACLNLLA